jgi:hypothetical protein
MFRCNRRRDLYVPALAIIACLTAGAPASLAEELTRHQSLAREILKELIEINTTDSVGDTTKAAQAMAARLEAAGFPKESLHVLGSHPRKGNLVARYPGTGARAPLLLLAHLDVVEARREDWSFDIPRAGRLLLWPRQHRRQGDGRHLGGEFHPHEGEGVHAGP